MDSNQELLKILQFISKNFKLFFSSKKLLSHKPHKERDIESQKSEIQSESKSRNQLGERF